jgi:hypothetical protein
VDLKAALAAAGVTATLAPAHPTQVEVDTDGEIAHGPDPAPGMVAIECSLTTDATGGKDGWEFDAFLIAVKDGQARSSAYVPRYQEKDLRTAPGTFGPGDVLLSPSTGGSAIYHLRIAGGDAILEACSGPHGQPYNVYDSKLVGLTKTLGDQFQKVATS